jgi:hypothetical protein
MAARDLSIDDNSLCVVTAAAGTRFVDLGLDLERRRRGDLDRLVSGLPLKRPPRPLQPPSALDEVAIKRLVPRVQVQIRRSEKLSMSSTEAARLIGLGRSTLCKLAKDTLISTRCCLS